ncbi:YceI family protein [Streptomyces sp. NPDC059340]|uniref:YceI family protein n=1 Tax=Streptomyces sp. NPDC059340 TaxID=3346806 RepID=UPI0036B0DF04
MLVAHRLGERTGNTPTGLPRCPGPHPPHTRGAETLTDGTYRLGPSTTRLLIKTGRAGLGRRAGHDLTIEATRWSGEAVLVVGALDRSSVSVSIETGSLKVREGTVRLKTLTDADRAEIERTLTDKTLLHTAEHPTITSRSTRVTGTPQSFQITGDLSIKGRPHPATVHGKGNGDGLVLGAWPARSPQSLRRSRTSRRVRARCR